MARRTFSCEFLPPVKGWDIVQKYSPGVLIGNWAEDRFGKGLGKNHLIVHHGERYMKNFISSYDQNYIRNYHSGIRHWDRHRIGWQPENSDHPLTGSSTNYGLKEAKIEEWKKLDKIRDYGDYDTLYALNYV